MDWFSSSYKSYFCTKCYYITSLMWIDKKKRSIAIFLNWKLKKGRESQRWFTPEEESSQWGNGKTMFLIFIVRTNSEGIEEWLNWKLKKGREFYSRSRREAETSPWELGFGVCDVVVVLPSPFPNFPFL